MGLAKVVNGQPEHVIGAHPCIVNVLEDETLMETHDWVIVRLQTDTTGEEVQDKEYVGDITQIQKLFVCRPTFFI